MTSPFLVGDWKVDPSAHTLSGASGEIRLEPKVMQVLVLLAKDAGRVVSKERLLQTVWADTFVGDEVLSRAISELRRSFGDDSKAPRVIQTIPKGGYRLMAPVRMPSGAGDPREAVQAASIGGSRETWTGRLIFASLAIAAVAVWFIKSTGRIQENRPAVTAGRTVRFTTFRGREQAPSFSPDGSRLAFQWNSEGGDAFRIFVRLIGNDPPQQLTNGPGSDLFPAWSPDGRTIAFSRSEGATMGIFVVPALGGPARKVIDVSDERSITCDPPAPQWSPDGRQLVFAIKDGPTCRVELLSLETFTRRALTSPPSPTFDYSPAFSPDGRSVAFIRVRTFYSGHVEVMSAEGGPSRQLTDDVGPIRGSLAWTQDGRSIVFGSDRDGSVALWRVALSGGSPERLQAQGDWVESPTFDHNGRRLAYVQLHEDAQIYDVDLTRPQDAPREVAPSSQRDGSPHLSADGRRLAFESARGGTKSETWLADADGLNPVHLTLSNGVVAGSPRWSPDGQSIAFDGGTGVEANEDIWVVGATGGRPRRLTSDSAQDAIPSWSRDGRWIYFMSTRTGVSQIWKVPSDGGQALQVTQAGGLAAYESWDGQYLYYTKSESDGRIWRVRLSGGGEELVLSEPLPFGYARCWALVDDGLYYVESESVDRRPSLAFFNFTTRRATRVTTLSMRVEPYNSNLTISPDRHHLLVALVEQTESDIMLTDLQ